MRTTAPVTVGSWASRVMKSLLSPPAPGADLATFHVQVGKSSPVQGLPWTVAVLHIRLLWSPLVPKSLFRRSKTLLGKPQGTRQAPALERQLCDPALPRRKDKRRKDGDGAKEGSDYSSGKKVPPPYCTYLPSSDFGKV